MTNKTATILLAAAALILTLLLAPATADASPAGTWTANVGGQSLVLELNADGSGTLNGDAGRWSVRGSTLTLYDANGDSINARYSSSQITAVVEGVTIVFRRTSPPPAVTGGARRPPAQSGGKFKPNKTVKARTKRLPDGRASVKVPVGWKSGWSNDGEQFVLAPGGKLKGNAVATISYDLLSPADKAKPMSALLTAAAAELVDEPSARVVLGPENFTVGGKRAGRMIGRATSNGVAVEGYLGGVIVGDFGIMVVGLYPQKDAAVMRASLDTVLASIRAKVPKPNRTAMRRIVGCWVNSSYESGSTGSTSAGSQYNFTSNQTFRYKSFVSVTIPSSGSSMPDGSNVNSHGEKVGTFAIFSNELYLRFDDGTTKSYRVAALRGGVKIGTRLYTKC